MQLHCDVPPRRASRKYITESPASSEPNPSTATNPAHRCLQPSRITSRQQRKKSLQRQPTCSASWIPRQNIAPFPKHSPPDDRSSNRRLKTRLHPSRQASLSHVATQHLSPPGAHISETIRLSPPSKPWGSRTPFGTYPAPRNNQHVRNSHTERNTTLSFSLRITTPSHAELATAPTAPTAYLQSNLLQRKATTASETSTPRAPPSALARRSLVSKPSSTRILNRRLTPRRPITSSNHGRCEITSHCNSVGSNPSRPPSTHRHTSFPSPAAPIATRLDHGTAWQEALHYRSRSPSHLADQISIRHPPVSQLNRQRYC